MEFTTGTRAQAGDTPVAKKTKKVRLARVAKQLNSSNFQMQRLLLWIIPEIASSKEKKSECPKNVELSNFMKLYHSIGLQGSRYSDER